LVFALTGPFLWPYVRMQQRFNFERTPQEIITHSATLDAYQAGTATSRAQVEAPVRKDWTQISHAALVELLVGGSEWKAAVEELGGSFNARFIGQRGGGA